MTDATRHAVPQAAWHALPAASALLQCGSREDGLSEAEALARHRRLGPNTLPEAPPRPAWRRLLSQFASPLIYLLVVAALIAWSLGHRGDAGVIAAVLLLNALIGHLQEGRAERSMAALRQLSALQVRVRRDGREQQVPAAALVPGDLLLLAAGDAVGADARLLEAAQLQLAEAALTGESVPVAKSTAPLPEAAALADRHNMVYAGTTVTAGRARAVVVATGAHTEVGRIARLTEQAQEPPTPLAQRLAQFGRGLVIASLLLFVAVVLLGQWRGMALTEVLMVAISQMVSLVPEGLPVAMTIALAVGMQRMAARGAVIRQLSAVETLGSTTVICSDKTGTLTRNEMTAVQLWLAPPTGTGPAAGWVARVSGSGHDAAGEIGFEPAPVAPPPEALVALLSAGALCNDASWRPDPSGAAQAQGDPTELALLVLAAKGGLDPAGLQAQAPRVAELPFDADRQLMATWQAAGPAVAVKGSPEALLRLCTGLDETARAAVRRQAEAMAGAALRVLAVGQVDAPAGEGPAASEGFDGLQGRVRLLGLVGQMDPPRDEARAAIAACRRAGIRPLMLTGDHRLTGLAIARDLGLALEGDRAVDGPELERMGEAELRDALPGIAVFARVQPAQKLRIVEALQAGGEVVAMTGDGVNDAPALARADVGVAMGRSGTEVAKGAAKVVLTDDSFATIVAAVAQGRVVYDNLRKVIVYLFATSLDEVLLLLVALLTGLPLPLLAVQILWINVVTEGTLTVNLVMDPADGSELQRPPTPRSEPLLGPAMLGRIAWMAGVATSTALAWFAWRWQQGVPLETVRTEVFTLVVMNQWFNLLNCRSALGSVFTGRLAGNRWLLGGLLVAVGLQLAVLYLPALAVLFHTVPLPADTLLALVVVASAVLWAEEGRKAWGRARGAA